MDVKLTSKRRLWKIGRSLYN